MANLTKNRRSGNTLARSGQGPLIATVESSSSDRVYEIREASDGTHIYCNCPAWRFQKGLAPKERTCKHLKSFLGDRTFAAPKASKRLRG